ncbi:MAG: hypothetical protein J3K34DRAFT_186416 [Monoraphidium minutum]|nr:MAG: hypothetical protein J3K34DRAFT_186416 [Monoraphidium minutum]
MPRAASRAARGPRRPAPPSARAPRSPPRRRHRPGAPARPAWPGARARVPVPARPSLAPTWPGSCAAARPTPAPAPALARCPCPGAPCLVKTCSAVAVSSAASPCAPCVTPGWPLPRPHPCDPSPRRLQPCCCCAPLRAAAAGGGRVPLCLNAHLWTRQARPTRPASDTAPWSVVEIEQMRVRPEPRSRAAVRAAV